MVKRSIVFTSPRRIAQDFVRAVERLNLDIGVAGFLINVRMVTLRELAIRGLNLRARTIPIEAEDLIMCSLRSADPRTVANPDAARQATDCIRARS